MSTAQDILQKLLNGALSIETALEKLALAPIRAHEAVLDASRQLRTGSAEIVYGHSKSAEQIVTILQALAKHDKPALCSRVSQDKAQRVCASIAQAVYDESSQTLRIGTSPGSLAGDIQIVTGGTSDATVAREAQATLAHLGIEAHCIFDVGVASLHRILEHVPRLREADGVIVVAGMEGALPSVVAGLIDVPLVAVPASTGYGVSASGLVALASMLSSCSPGITVVNIDNGVGAAIAMARVVRKIQSCQEPTDDDKTTL